MGERGRSFENEHVENGLSDEQLLRFFHTMKPTVVIVDSQIKKNIIQGAGTLLNEEGLVLTVFHVIADGLKEGGNISVTFAGEDKFYLANMVAAEPTLDLALIKVENVTNSYAKIGYENVVKIGEDVMSISHPNFIEYTCVKGHISSDRRRCRDIVDSRLYKASFKDVDPEMDVLQVSNTHYPMGGSGGPLFNSKGLVIGVIFFMVEQTNFAIPLDVIKGFLEKYGDPNFPSGTSPYHARVASSSKQQKKLAGKLKVGSSSKGR